MSRLAESERRSLLEIARRSLVAAVHGLTFDEQPPLSENLRTPAGAFVTLWHGPRLRGCIGQFAGAEPLAQIVAHCARLAALEDPRFRSVAREELDDLTIEISVLSDLEEIAPEDIRVGQHGLVVTSSAGRGVLLPKVAAEFGWTAERFLEETCVKAGLERDAWRSRGTVIQAFTAEVFSESAANAGECPAERYSIST
ncbi:MAG TPA: AmmeMemoRadiSam system protein A [Candidatus Cybelea sp.]|nr:AmmeMemoRadiSam system protein A [Candidatus Cybelea sp.]